MAALVIYVRLHDGRYHGRGDWPPSPARLFQALVAAAGLGGALREAERTALKWLEEQRAPIIAAPRASQPRRGVLFYMPNNDTDRIEGDPLKTAKIRTATKIFRPYFFDPVIPFVYVWSVGRRAEDQQNAEVIRSLAECLYQLGRGIDMAWAWGEMLEDSELDELLAAHPGRVFRPSKGGDGIVLPAPCPDSLVSLDRRYLAYGTRFSYRREGNGVKVVFRQPPKPRFQPIAYDCPPSRQLFELRDPVAEGTFAPWPLNRAYQLVVALRDAAVERLKRAMPAHAADIDRVLVGRKPDGTNDGLPENRVRIIPLSSVGHIHADHQIRRVLVEVPPSCSLGPDDVQWAFSGLDIVASDTGEALATLLRTDDGDFLRNYGVEDDSPRRLWRTVTPAALPESAQRRRIDPARKDQEAKAGTERKQEQVHAAAAVCQALRHEGVRLRPEIIRVQREPFDANGERAETFAEDTRFSKHQLWHVEVEFRDSVQGPLVIGDGRFLGLGIMATKRVRAPGLHLFQVAGSLTLPMEGGPVILRALRRAVMARTQSVIGANRPLPLLFHGHEPDGMPARGGRHAHLFFAAYSSSGETRIDRLAIMAPDFCDRNSRTARYWDILARAIEGLQFLGSERPKGTFQLTPLSMHDENVFGLSRVWQTVTAYQTTRHPKRGQTDSEFIAADLRVECARRALPMPLMVESIDIRNGPRGSLSARLRLTFKAAVRGPLLLGRGSHFGAGLFTTV